jgi:phosphoribosylformylglycinamidine synthase subunit PurQ / glutaminase
MKSNQSVQPRVAVLRTDGINCDEELFYAFEAAGGKSEMIHVNELLSKKKKLDNYQILALPGGFSYGDDILSAKILANELINKLDKQISNFIAKEKLVIGVCNGFQALVRMGYLPWKMNPGEDVSLIFNDSGHFECRWIKLKINKSNCVFTRNLDDQTFDLPTAHGEGKLVIKNRRVGERLDDGGHIVAQYVNGDGSTAKAYPANPNGSYNSIGAVTDVSGHILGIMPHPERNILKHHHPSWRQTKIHTCLQIFQNAINYSTIGY